MDDLFQLFPGINTYIHKPVMIKSCFWYVSLIVILQSRPTKATSRASSKTTGLGKRIRNSFQAEVDTFVLIRSRKEKQMNRNCKTLGEIS